MANTNTMDFLKKEGSVRVYPGMIVVYPQYRQEEDLKTDLVPKFNGCYATNNSTVCFVSDGEIFVTPYTQEVMNILCSNGLIQKDFWVPFSNWDYPKEEKSKWDELLKKAKEIRNKEFKKDCIDYCEKHGIGALDEGTLKACFAMPETGVKVDHIYYKQTYYPEITGTVLDCVAIDKLGTYSTNNGRVVFIYQDGTTYVTRGYRILKKLREAGYREAGIFVPFSNGEVIQDPELAEKWSLIVSRYIM